MNAWRRWPEPGIAIPQHARYVGNSPRVSVELAEFSMKQLPMGMSKLRRAQFFSAHPWCCFCGGSAPATTEDHIPGRAIFDSRNWPEGYSFPACDTCNGLTRFDEIIITMLSRIRSRGDLTTDQQDLEMRRAMDGVRNNFPDAYKAMRVRANDVRRFLKNTGREKAAGALLSDVPVIQLNQPEFHYKHVGVTELFPS